MAKRPKTPSEKNTSDLISGWIDKLKGFDYWKIFSRVAVGSILCYILKVMKDVPNK